MSQLEDYKKLVSYLESEIKVQPKKEGKTDVREVHSDVPRYDRKRTSPSFNIYQFEDAKRDKLIKNFEKRYRRNKLTTSVTEILGCVRKNYYLRLRFPIDFKKHFRFAYLDFITTMGNKMHDYVQELYNFDAVELPIESKEHKVKGRIDALKGKENLIELKSIDVEKINDIKTNHYEQGLVYSYILNKYYGYDINLITVVYIGRDLRTIVPMDAPINWSTETVKVESILNRSLTLLKAVKDKKLPEPFGSTKEECKFCPYKDICGDNEIKAETESKENKKEAVFLL